MGFDTALTRLNGLGAAALAPLPGLLLLGLLAFGLSLLLPLQHGRGDRFGTAVAEQPWESTP